MMHQTTRLLFFNFAILIPLGGKKLKMYQEGGEFCQLSSMITTTYRVYSNFSASD